MHAGSDGQPCRPAARAVFQHEGHDQTQLVGQRAEAGQQVGTGLRMAPVMAQVFADRGDRVLVVRGDNGWDEISPYGGTQVWDTTRGGVTEERLEAGDLGMGDIAEGALAGGDAVTNAEVCRAAFGMRRMHPELPLPSDIDAVRAVVIANAAAALAAHSAAVAAADGEYVQGSLRDRVRAHLVDARAAVEALLAGQPVAVEMTVPAVASKPM